MAGKRLCLWLCIWTLALGLISAPAGLAMTLEEPRPSGEDAPQATGHHVTLEGRTIGGGECLSYETVAPELAGNPFAADYYPGDLTVELTGQIVIESRGNLTIGTLSIGNEKERSPVIHGTLRPDGLIVVKAGGSLTLKTAAFDLDGEGLFIVQEPGGSVTLDDTPLEEALVRWAPPTVGNYYDQPEPIWLEAGTALTGDRLPKTLVSWLQTQGASQRKELALVWSMEDYDGRTDGELTLTGRFLDEEGVPLLSVFPLEVTVHWVKPDQLIITDATWLGQAAASAKLELKELPQEATEVWGEVSADGGESWQRWEGFELRRDEAVTTGVFSLPDATPRQFRIRAANQRQHLYWMSDSVLLPKESGKPSDQGGNRGGSTAVLRPSRTPEPTPSPAPTPEPTPTPAPTPEPTPTPTPTPTVEPTPVPSPSVGHGILDVPTRSTASPVEEPTPTPEATPPVAVAIAPATPAPSEPVSTVQPTPAPSVGHGIPDVPSTPSAEPIPTHSPSPEKPIPSPSVGSGIPDAPPSSAPAPVLQVLLVAAGALVCGLVGVFVARRKRK